MKGRIIRGVCGFYYVNDQQGEVHECKACGRFRKEKITPLVGDMVEFSRQNGLEYGFIESIETRKNELLRPAVANVDKLVVVVSASKPHIDFMLCDKLLIQAARANIQPLVCINKMETGAKSMEEIKKQYSAYDVLCVSAMDRIGLGELMEYIRGECVCFSGQSAVGKSSLINAIDGAMQLEVGNLSKKTDRGKHTTRTTELLYLSKLDAYVFDTPGFSMFDMRNMDAGELGQWYPEFIPYAQNCRFASCMHDKEPDCGIKQAVEQGNIDPLRYERYIKLKNNLEEKR